MNNNDDNMFYMEKTQTNKKGIFIVIVIFLIACGAGAFYLYKNKEKFDFKFTLPWETYEVEKKKEKKNEKDSSKPKVVGNLVVPNLDNDDYFGEAHARISDLKADEKGYYFNFKFYIADERSTASHKIIIKRILLDGIEVETDEYELSIDAINRETTRNIYIPKTSLDFNGITNFNEITFLYNNGKKTADGALIIKSEKVKTKQNIPATNTIRGKITFDEINDLKFSYLKVEEDSENNYIYFTVQNLKSSEEVYLRVKKLLVNNKLIDMSKFETSVYCLGEKIFYLEIPKKEVKKIDEFSVSFFSINKVNGAVKEIFITSEYNKKVKS